MLIVFSGIDGAGKSTQIESLKEWLISQKINVKVLWARGGYTPFMTFLKKFLRIFLGKSVIPSGKSKLRSEKLSKPHIATIWILLSIIDLILYWSIYLRIMQLLGYTIICDRYLYDTNLDFKRNFKLISFEKFFLWKFLLRTLPKPDLSLLLIISAKESRARSVLKDEPFPDTQETIEWRLTEYNNEKYIKKNMFIKIICTDSIISVRNKIILLVKNKISNI